MFFGCCLVLTAGAIPAVWMWQMVTLTHCHIRYPAQVLFAGAGACVELSAPARRSRCLPVSHAINNGPDCHCTFQLQCCVLVRVQQTNVRFTVRVKVTSAGSLQAIFGLHLHDHGRVMTVRPHTVWGAFACFAVEAQPVRIAVAPSNKLLCRAHRPAVGA